MQLSWQHFAGGVGLVFAAMLAWFGAIWLNLQGANLWIFRICLFILVGLIVAAIIWWLQNRQKNRSSAASTGDPGASEGIANDILSILNEAEARLGSSTQLPRGTKLTSLPVIFLLGDSGSGKTSVAIQSGLEPELLSGQVFQEGNVISTRLANLWFAQKTALVEMGGKTLADANIWTRMLSRLALSKFKAIFTGKQAAPRAAVVCMDSERLAKAASAEEITTYSRALRARLEQISQTLGISFPVYVVFTRADKTPYFDDYFRNLAESEITQVLGSTLSPRPAFTSSVYAEQETKRITTAFNSIFYSLAECRPGLLYRERSTDKLPGIYEFPREFQKRITLATQFLVDLCRPSHLRATPFLRGFYFTGTRMVDAAASGSGTVIATQTAVAKAASFSPNATSIMRMDEFAQTKAWQSSTQNIFGGQGQGQKVTQFLFVSHIFSHIILEDRAALGASGTSSRPNLWKRVILATVSAIAVIWLLGLLVSFFGNMSLESEVRSVAERIDPIRPQGLSAASFDDLQHLDAARQELVKLAAYERDGAPWHLRWGLYSGTGLYKDLRSVYFNRFRNLLFGDVQTTMLNYLKNLPLAASPTDDWQKPYETLKAYLMTTSNPEKTTREFLSPLLMNRWTGGNEVNEPRLSLAQTQFDFYTTELPIANPYYTPADTFAIAQARRFLNSFSSGPQLIYQKMLAKANQNAPKFNFAVSYPDAKDLVTDSRIVDGAFTEAGWKIMNDAISHPETYIGGDDWVLGVSDGAHVASGVSSQELRSLYETDYKKQWRDFLNAASVRHFGTPQDEARQLEKLSGNRSPLLALLCEVSQNTAVTSPEVVKAFQPVQEVVAAGQPPQSCRERLKQPVNDPYTGALSTVKTCLDQYLSMPPQAGVSPDPRDAKLTECNTLSLQAGTAGRQLVKTIDPEGKVDTTVTALLLTPTTPVRPPKKKLEGAAKFCSTLSVLQGKFPFNPSANAQATLTEFNAIFQPKTGSLAQFLAQNMDAVEQQGTQYVAKSDAVKPGLLNLINQAAGIQHVIYPNGAAQLQLQFTLKARAPESFTAEIVTIDGQKMQANSAAVESLTFKWPGAAGEAILGLSNGGPAINYFQYRGVWAAFHFFDSYSWSQKGTAFQLQAPLQGVGGQPATTPDGKPIKVEFELDSGGVPLFQHGYLSHLKCPAL